MTDLCLLPPVMSERRPAGRLGRDTRGAILILGIALGLVLATAVSYLVAIGDGILWREAAQNAADAGAFENAVWHARGMNMIAALNILLSLLTGVIVLWRLTLMALAFATLTELVSSMQQPGVERARASLPLSPLVDMLSRDEEVVERISLIAEGLSAAQIAVATYTPILGTQVRSPKLNLRGDATEAATFSGSLLPVTESPPVIGDAATQLEHAASNLSANQSNGALSGVSNRLGAPFSLPVEPESHSLLCPRLPRGHERRSAALAMKLPAAWSSLLLNAPGPEQQRALVELGIEGHSQGALPLLESLYELKETGAPALLCGRAGAPLERLKQAMWKVAERANEQLAVGDATLTNKIRSHLRDPETSLASVPEARALFRRWQSSFELDASEFRFGRPVKVWSQAKNGNVYFRSTAVVSAKIDPMSSVPFSVADALPATPARIWAHAEMYFDCTEPWNECGPNATWQLAWSARLRRIQPYGLLLRREGVNPIHVVPSDLETTIVYWLERSTTRLGRNFGRPEVRGFVPELEAVQIRNTPAFGLLDASRTDLSTDASLAAFLQHQAAANSIIH